MKPNIYIDGREGTTGLQIYDRLEGRDDIELLLIDEDKRKELYREQKLSMTVVKPDKVYPNDPCPCGSGKKYKKCCGKKG